MVHEPGETSPNQTQLTQEPYYSNRGRKPPLGWPDHQCIECCLLDITIIHSVVSLAQDELHRSTYPKPLPAAILFKAYDDVLPTFGIDPDSDHHLSALIFRIGGEHGEGSLLEKFEAILKRMGILLEFGENATESEDSYHSDPPRPAKDQEVAIDLLKESEEGRLEGRRKELPPELVSSESAFPWRRTEENGVRNDQAGRTLAFSNISTPRNRWPVSGERHGDEDLLQISSAKHPTGLSFIHPKRLQTASSSGAGLMSGFDDRRKIASTSVEHSPESNDANAQEGSTASVSNARPQSLASIKLCGGNVKDTHPVSDINTSDSNSIEHELLGSMAVRARQIYLASKVFNKWADETATRLEREAIARRHMIRFRCFNSWTLAPDSKAPITLHLKAVTAVQKLRRAVTCQEEQLSLGASLISQNHLRKKSRYWLGYWSTLSLARQSAEISGRCIRFHLIETWHKRAFAYRDSTRYLTKRSRRRMNSDICGRWIEFMHVHRVQAHAAKQVRSSLDTAVWFWKWRDQEEAKLRARACRKLLVMENAAQVFESWNLRTRAQAFHWTLEYLSVGRCMNIWFTVTKCHLVRQIASSNHAKTMRAGCFFNRLRFHKEKQLELGHLEERARWYIWATRLIRIFDITARYHKHQNRLVVRGYLMMRYTEVSSKRRQRGFYKALDCWLSHTAHMSGIDQAGHDYLAKLELDNRRASVLLWKQFTLQSDASLSLGIDCRKHYLLDEWKYGALHDEQLQKAAMEQWSSERQREAVKIWTISTLQRSGQAHSAIMVRQRHKRETRNRAFLFWRRHTNPAETNLLEPQSPAWDGPLSISRKTTRSLPKTRTYFRRFDDNQDLPSPLHTPSRSTGFALPTSRTLPIRLMDPVEEVDAESVGNSSDKPGKPDPGGLMHGNLGPSRVLSSTTPRAPIPISIRRAMHNPLSAAGHRSQGSSARPIGPPRTLDNSDRFNDSAFLSTRSKSAVSKWSRLAGRSNNDVQTTSSTPSVSRPIFARPVPMHAPSLQQDDDAVLRV